MVSKGRTTESEDRVPLSSVDTAGILDFCAVPKDVDAVSSAGVCLCGLGTECKDSSTENGKTPTE